VVGTDAKPVLMELSQRREGAKEDTMGTVRIGVVFLDFGGNACRVISFRRADHRECVVVRHGDRPGRKRFWPKSRVLECLGR